MLDNEKRLRSVQWLTKWEEFRKEKSVWIDKVLAILKQKRKVINLIALMKAVEMLKIQGELYKQKK